MTTAMLIKSPVGDGLNKGAAGRRRPTVPSHPVGQHGGERGRRSVRPWEEQEDTYNTVYT